MNLIDRLSKEYTQSYISNASELFDIPYISNVLPRIISDILSDNYMAVDIGSCDGSYSNSITNHIPTINGCFENVDLYPIKPDIILCDAVEFIQNTNTIYDLIICKHAIHLFSPLELFFDLCYDKTSSTGKMFVVTLTNETIIPWTTNVNNLFMETFVRVEKFIGKWNVIIHKGILQKKCSVTTLCNIIKNRSLSFLYKLSDVELNQCIYELEASLNEVVDIELYYNIYELSH